MNDQTAPAPYAEGSLIVGQLSGYLYIVLAQDGGEGLRVRRVATGRILHIYMHTTEPFTQVHEDKLAGRTFAQPAAA